MDFFPRKAMSGLTRRNFLQASFALSASGVLAAPRSSPLSLAYAEHYDILDEVLGKRMGITLNHYGYPWKRAQYLVQTGAHDALCATATKERLDYAAPSQEYVMRVPFRLFVRADNPLLPALRLARNIDDLRGLDPLLISSAGNGWVAENFASFRTYALGPTETIARMLDAGRGDIVVDNVITMQKLLRDTPPKNEILMLPHDFSHIGWTLLINKQSQHVGLLPAFDKAMAKFRGEPGYAPGRVCRHGKPANAGCRGDGKLSRSSQSTCAYFSLCLTNKRFCQKLSA